MIGTSEERVAPPQPDLSALYEDLDAPAAPKLPDFDSSSSFHFQAQQGPIRVASPQLREKVIIADQPEHSPQSLGYLTETESEYVTGKNMTAGLTSIFTSETSMNTSSLSRIADESTNYSQATYTESEAPKLYSRAPIKLDQVDETDEESISVSVDESTSTRSIDMITSSVDTSTTTTQIVKQKNDNIDSMAEKSQSASNIYVDNSFHDTSKLAYTPRAQTARVVSHQVENTTACCNLL